LSFTETMTGWFDPQTTGLANTRAFLERDREVRLARRSSGRVPAPLSFRLTITVDDLETFLADPGHLATVEGYVDGPWGHKRLVERASFNLLVDAAEPDTKKTRYVLCFYDESGAPLRLEGEKRVHDDDGYDSFADATTLFVTVREGFAPGGPVQGQGVMHIEGPDLLRQLATFRAHRAPSFEASVTALTRFGAFFFGNLWEPFVRPRLFGSEVGAD
jgi:cholesterol oxidase